MSETEFAIRTEPEANIIKRMYDKEIATAPIERRIEPINVVFFLYIFPFFSLSSIIFLKKKDYYIYILLVLSIFAATTSNPPFGYIFEDIMLYIGPLRVFYEADAYYPILVILYSILVPFTFY